MNRSLEALKSFLLNLGLRGKLKTAKVEEKMNHSLLHYVHSLCYLSKSIVSSAKLACPLDSLQKYRFLLFVVLQRIPNHQERQLFCNDLWSHLR